MNDQAGGGGFAAGGTSVTQVWKKRTRMCLGLEGLGEFGDPFSELPSGRGWAKDGHGGPAPPTG